VPNVLHRWKVPVWPEPTLQARYDMQNLGEDGPSFESRISTSNMLRIPSASGSCA